MMGLMKGRTRDSQDKSPAHGSDNNRIKKDEPRTISQYIPIHETDLITYRTSDSNLGIYPPYVIRHSINYLTVHPQATVASEGREDDKNQKEKKEWKKELSFE